MTHSHASAHPLSCAATPSACDGRGLSIRDCHAQGMSAREAGIALGCSTEAAYMRARWLGLALRPVLTRLPEMTPEQRKEYNRLSKNYGIPRAEALAAIGVAVNPGTNMEAAL